MPQSDRSSQHQAAFRAKRREAGWAKCSFWLPPEDLARLERLKAIHGTQEAAVRAALAQMMAE